MTFDDSSANIDLVPGGLNKNLDDSSTRIDLVPDDLGKNLYEFALMAFQSQGRAQVVSVQSELATARITMIRNPVFLPGIQMRLDRKMPTR